MTFEKDVTGYGRKMGRNGGGNGINMEDPHPYTDAELDGRAGVNGFKYGSYTPGKGIIYRTENPSNTEAYGSGDYKPRKTGQGLPWDL